MIRIGRPINGITINGLEYIQDADGSEMTFEGEYTARTFLNEKGISDDMIEDTGIVFIEADDQKEEISLTL